MRCCLETLYEYIETHADEECTEGETLDCKYEKPGNANIILCDGIWRWNVSDIKRFSES